MSHLRSHFSLHIGLLLLIFSLLSGCHSKKNKLELSLEKGVTYRQQMVSEMIVVETINGLPLTMSMHSTGKIACKVLAITDSDFKMEASYECLAMKMEVPNRAMNFSSEKINAQDTFSTLLSNLKDKPFMFNLSKTGKILKISHMDALFLNLMQNIPTLKDVQKKQILDKLKQSFGEDAFRRNMEMVTAIFPALPVSLNEQWQITTPQQKNFLGKSETTYTLLGQNNSFYILSGKGQMEEVSNDSTLQLNGLLLKSYVKGTADSEITIDKKTGWVIKGVISQLLTGSYTVRLNKNQPGGMIIPVRFNNKIKFSH